MTIATGARLGLNWNFVAGNSGWGASFNLMSRLLDGLFGLVLISAATTTPPTSPADGDAYHVPLAATGAWTSHAGTVAVYQDGDWNFYGLPPGVRARITDQTGFFWWDGTTWQPEVTLSGTVLSVNGQTPDGTGNISLGVGNISGAAPLSNPGLTAGTTTTAAAHSRNTRIANTKYVDDGIDVALGTLGSAAFHVATDFVLAGSLGTAAFHDISYFVVAGSLDSAAFQPTSAFKAAGAVESWATLPAEAQNLPLGFIMPGLPAASQVYNLVMVMSVTIPANFAGTKSYQNTQATASAAFTLRKISGGVTTTIGTITLGTGSKTAITLSTQAQVTLAAGDVLQLVAPSAQDATMADVGITILAAKV